MTGCIQMLNELISDWHQVIKRDGLKAIQYHVLKEVLSLPYRHIKYVVLALPLSGSFPEVESKAVLDIRSFNLSDLDFVRDEYLPSEANLCRRRLQLGHRGFVATIKGKTVGYIWLCMDLSLERIKLNLDQGDILVNDAFTAPAFRNRGVKTTLSLAILQSAYDLGYKRLIVYIDENNAPSLAVWRRKLRGKTIDRIDFKRIGVWRRTRHI